MPQGVACLSLAVPEKSRRTNEIYLEQEKL
jgi:hypothetical protein